jgi:hypothetical protein
VFRGRIFSKGKKGLQEVYDTMTRFRFRAYKPPRVLLIRT